MLQHTGDWIQQAGLDPAVIPMALSESTCYLHAHWGYQGSWEHLKELSECNTDIIRINRLHTCCFRRIWSCSLLSAHPGAGRNMRIFSMLCSSPCYTCVTVSRLSVASLGQTHSSSALLYKKEPFWANPATAELTSVPPPCSLWPRLVWLEGCTISSSLCAPEKWCRDRTEHTGEKRKKKLRHYLSLPFFSHRITE